MIAVPIYESESVFELLDDNAITFADFYDFKETGYGALDLEQWGSDPNIKQLVVSGYSIEKGNISENFQVDLRNEDQFRDANQRVLLYAHGRCGVADQDEILGCYEEEIYDKDDNVIEKVVSLYEY